MLLVCSWPFDCLASFISFLLVTSRRYIIAVAGLLTSGSGSAAVRAGAGVTATRATARAALLPTIK